jgi:hypothetical protein
MAGKAQPKPRAPRLKVFRTAIGFHDAYVAAPSRKAALAAWGTDKDLFARGAAEEVTDPALAAEPLGTPGTVVRRLRSAPDEPVPARRKAKSRPPVAPKDRPAGKPAAPPPPPPPRPSSKALEEARRALEDTRQRHENEQRELAARERELASERRATEERQGKELRLLARRLKEAEQDYQARLARWRQQGGYETSGLA